MKQQVKRYVYEESDDYDLPEDPKEFMAFWQEKIDLIPTEFTDTAKITIDAIGGYGSDASLEITVFYLRPETDEEVLVRENRAMKYLETNKERELKLFARLKDKYNL